MYVKNETNVNGGIGFCGALTIVLVALKLLGATTLSWWWVWAPLWLPIVAIVGLLLIGAAVTFVSLSCAFAWEEFKAWRLRKKNKQL